MKEPSTGLNAISIASKRTSIDKLKERNSHAAILDLTSRGVEPWVCFSPFYPHGDIPVPFHSGLTAASVEGVWQGLKVFENADIDQSKFSITTMKGIKRSSRRFGKVQGHKAGDQLLPYLDARKLIYLPSYLWVLENKLTAEIGEIRNLLSQQPIILLDYETNTDISDLSRPLSHAGLVKLYLENCWPA